MVRTIVRQKGLEGLQASAPLLQLEQILLGRAAVEHRLIEGLLPQEALLALRGDGGEYG
jgi:hypothetical protein